MFAPVPLEPVFTEERRIVSALEPRLDEGRLRFFRDLFSTFVAVLVGGGGGAGGGVGAGILGVLHIVQDVLVLDLMLMLEEPNN